ncbi:hypothetical protein VTK73DRAFT_9630 [Phialemonium thermophilum]|uniref:chitinase n=1 Tax=Phialemonium thermophilum TaxID=223376 RepID=A0ABR3XL33_9PEZI
MYLTGQHPEPPPRADLQEVTHVALAFMNSGLFNDPTRLSWPLFTDVDTVRSQFPATTKVLVAIGGWGDTAGFSEAALSEKSRRTFAQNIGRMIQETGADGVDIDWEYPGGNGEDYKQVPNEAKKWEIGAYPLLLAEIRRALGHKKIISAAVPGLERDMLAFTRETVPRIMQHVDFLNVMTYDLMNRRDNVTKHHTSAHASVTALDRYVANGAAPQNLNLGLAFYVKYALTKHESCREAASPVGCPTLLLEDPKTGADMGRMGGFAWHDDVPDEVSESFNRALLHGSYDSDEGAYYYWDEEEDLWWTFDTAEAITRKVNRVFDTRRELGGVFAWGLGEDGPSFQHYKALTDVLAARMARRDEL